MFSTTEITSNEIASDNPIHQRLFFAYQQAAKLTKGNLLEIGCGVGRGMEVMINSCAHYTGLDKNEDLLTELQQIYQHATFIHQNIPPLYNLEDNTFDWVITFQVIEHIQNDDLFIKEIYRVLKPGGKVVITTPNKKLSLTRNPWHIREYFPKELENLLKKYFNKLDLKGIHGNEKVMGYYEENKKSVRKVMKWDILNLQYILPASVLKIPYDIMNRRNRKKLLNQTGLAAEIVSNDYFIANDVENCLDFFYIAEK